MALGPRIATGVAAVAIPLICTFEGLRVNAYLDPIGIPTVCFGHIEGVRMTDKYTPDECKEMLLTDLPRYNADVLRCIRVPMTDKRHAAILSFTYNVGGAALCKSSVARGLNAGNVRAGCDALLLYTKAGGHDLPGLVRRRKAEHKLCIEPGPISVVAAPVVKPEVIPQPEIKVPEIRPQPETKPYEPKTFIGRAWGWLKRYWRYQWSD